MHILPVLPHPDLAAKERRHETRSAPSVRTFHDPPSPWSISLSLWRHHHANAPARRHLPARSLLPGPFLRFIFRPLRPPFFSSIFSDRLVPRDDERRDAAGSSQSHASSTKLQQQQNVAAPLFSHRRVEKLPFQSYSAGNKDSSQHRLRKTVSQAYWLPPVVKLLVMCKTGGSTIFRRRSSHGVRSSQKLAVSLALRAGATYIKPQNNILMQVHRLFMVAVHPGGTRLYV